MKKKNKNEINFAVLPLSTRGWKSYTGSKRIGDLRCWGFPVTSLVTRSRGARKRSVSFVRPIYQVTFPMFAKVVVKGPNAHPLFKYLTSEAKGILTKSIKWNFTKFLVDREGRVVKRYASTTSPAKIADDIEQLLG